MSNSLYARDATGAYKELSAVQVSPGVWGLAVSGSSGGGSSVAVYSTRVDDLGSVIYKGLADIGSADGAAVWQVQKIETVGTVLSIKYAAAGAFTSVWNDRASLTYA